MFRTPMIAAGALLLVACAEDRTAYPSLAPRPIEKKGFAEPEVPAAKLVPDPALDTKIAGFSQALDTLIKGFDADAGKAQVAARAATGQPAGSEPWIEAQTALAGLDDWRAQASAVSTDIEQAAIDRAATLAPDYPALQAVRDRASAEIARETDAIGKIQSSLAPA